jgi:ribosomal protein S10
MLVENYRIKIKTPDKQIFSFFCSLFQENQIFKTVSLPRKTKRFTFIRSPHINSSSKEHFHLINHRRLFFLTVDRITLDSVLSKIPDTAVVQIVKLSTFSKMSPKNYKTPYTLSQSETDDLGLPPLVLFYDFSSLMVFILLSFRRLPMLTSLLFIYFFCSCSFVISCRNPIFSLLSLIGSFIFSSVILLCSEVESLALSFIIVYFGVIATFFFFMLILLDIKISHFFVVYFKINPFLKVFSLTLCL